MHLHRFMGVDIETAPGVLVPREETELLGRTALDLLAGLPDAARVVDMCCGSGNLACAIALARPDLSVWACDLTAETVELARRNVARLGLSGRVVVARGDLFAALEGLDLEGRIDVIVANPPYISTARLDGESAHLLETEPRDAFDGGPYGIELHQRLLRDAASFLVPGGLLVMEFGANQERQIAALAARAKLWEPPSFQVDATGQPRVVAVRRRNSEEAVRVGETRALRSEDIPEVARLFVRTFRSPGATASSALEEYLRLHYLDAPGADPEIRPLVHLGGDGAITGFIGVTPLPMTFGDRPIRAAVCGTLMVDPRAHDPMAAPRLLKAFLAGPQDLSLSETANSTSLAMWTSLRGIALPAYSMEWVRVIRPAAFFLTLAASRFRFLRFARPLADVTDRLLRRRTDRRPRWSGLPVDAADKSRLVVEPIDPKGFAEAYRALTAHVALRPAYGDAQLSHVVAEAIAQTHRGPAALAAVRAPGGRLLGAGLWYMPPGGIARFLQIVAAPSRGPAVIDALLAHVARLGAVGATGRSDPSVAEALLGRHTSFWPFVNTVVHARDEALVAAFRAGDAVFNGLAGEMWSRLVDSDFD